MPFSDMLRHMLGTILLNMILLGVGWILIWLIPFVLLWVFNPKQFNQSYFNSQKVRERLEKLDSKPDPRYLMKPRWQRRS